MGNYRQRLFVPGLLVIGLVVSVISSLGAPLIPAIATRFDASLGSAQWSLTLTLLLGAISSPVIGRLGDGPHRRTVLLGCLAAVSFGGVLAATAPSLVVLLIGRALQGLGLAIMPLTMAAARDVLGPQVAQRAIGALSVVGLFGLGLGYPVTGVLARFVDIEAAFWFGVATSTLALAVAWWVMPTARDDAPRQRIDSIGAVLVTSGLAAFLLAFENGTDWGWLSPATLGLGGAAFALLAVWVRRSLRIAAPLVDLRLLRHRSVSSLSLSTALLGVATYQTVALAIQYAQLPQGLGRSVLAASLALIPMSIGSVLVSATLPWIERTIGSRRVTPAGSLVVAAAAGFSALTGDALWQLFVTMSLLGGGLGMALSTTPVRMLRTVPRDETSSVMSLYQVTRYAGYSIGSGMAVSLLYIFGSSEVPGAGAFGAAFASAGAFGVLSAFVAWRFDADDDPAAAARDAAPDEPTHGTADDPGPNEPIHRPVDDASGTAVPAVSP